MKRLKEFTKPKNSSQVEVLGPHHFSSLFLLLLLQNLFVFGSTFNATTQQVLGKQVLLANK